MTLTASPTSRTIAVTDVMHAGVISCPSQMPLGQVAALMAEHSVHAILVDGMTHVPLNHERLVRDFIIDLDLMRAAGSGRMDVEVGQVTVSQIVTVNPDENIVRAAQIMAERNCSHLIVISPDGVEPLGVISSLDVAGALVSRPPGPVT